MKVKVKVKLMKVKIIKATIPRGLREQVWLTEFGKTFEHKCYIRWCKNNIDVFNFQVGHNIPESKGGKTVLENLKPICIRCNQSMGNGYTIDEWNELGTECKEIKEKKKFCLFSWFKSKTKDSSH